MVKIAVVGPESSKWQGIDNAESKVKDETKKILNKYSNILRPIGCELEDIIFISGGCPKGGTDEWSEYQAREMLPSQNQIKIFKPDVNKWEDEIVECGTGFPDFKRFKGYKSRNIKIAETCDVLYCIVPYMEGQFCYHHRGETNIGPHPVNGGCFTRKEAMKLQKENHLVVIK